MSSHASPLPSPNGTVGPRQGSPRRETDLRLTLVPGPARLPGRSAPSDEELASDVVLRMANAVSDTPGAFLIDGGEPLRRADLLTLLHDLTRLRPSRLGMCTPGQGLTTTVLERLRSAGVQRLSIPFHSARKDAHDWLVGQPGALKVALRAIRACLDAGMPVTAEIVVTRPTMAHLAETVDVLTRVGVRSLCLRRLTANHVGAAEFVPLSPRMTLLAPDLEQAATVALQRRAQLSIRDFPLCVAPRLRRLFAGLDQEICVTVGGFPAGRTETGPRCQTCPGPPSCNGAPADYLARFGGEEIVDQAPKLARVQETVAQQLALQRSGTMVLSWRGPRRLACEACGDQDGVEPESTRVVRARLVDAARHRPAVLRLVGAELFAHPNAAELLFDAVRLFPRVECAGEGSPIAAWRDVDLSRLKPLHRIDLPLYGADATTHDGHCGVPGSFAATLQAVARLREQASIAAGTFAVLHDAAAVRPFAEAWSRGDLPGSPRFRLSARGSSLEALVECARDLPAGAARTALLAVLPRCLCESAGLADASPVESSQPDGPWRGVAFGQPVDWTPCGSDPVGEFSSCDKETCVSDGCPGTARGWDRETRSGRWMLNS